MASTPAPSDLRFPRCQPHLRCLRLRPLLRHCRPYRPYLRSPPCRPCRPCLRSPPCRPCPKPPMRRRSLPSLRPRPRQGSHSRGRTHRHWSGVRARCRGGRVQHGADRLTPSQAPRNKTPFAYRSTRWEESSPGSTKTVGGSSSTPIQHASRNGFSSQTGRRRSSCRAHTGPE